MSLDGKYVNGERVLYSVVSLIPAFLLALLHFRLSLASTEEKKEALLKRSGMYNAFCKLYYGISLLLGAYLVFARVQYRCQLTQQFVKSFFLSQVWLVYFYGVLQYTPAVLVSLMHTFKYGKTQTVAEPAKKEEKIMDQDQDI